MHSGPAVYSESIHTLSRLHKHHMCCDHMTLVVQVSAVVPELCVLFHESVQALSKAFLAKERRHVYITPTSYLELIHSYKTLLSRKQNEVRTPPVLCRCPLTWCMSRAVSCAPVSCAL